jgi:hypothetical protein
MRRGLAYGLAGAIRAGDRIKAVARGAVDGARNASHSADQPEDASTEANRPSAQA